MDSWNMLIFNKNKVNFSPDIIKKPVFVFIIQISDFSFMCPAPCCGWADTDYQVICAYL